MTFDKKVATTVGVLLIIGTVAGILSLVLTGPILGGPDYLAKVAANPLSVSLGALMVLIMGLSLALVPVVIYPVLKKHNEILAVGYLVFRGALETVVTLVTVYCWLVLILLGREYMSAGTPGSAGVLDLGNLMLKVTDISSAVASIIFPLGAMMLYTVFYQSGLIPRWLSAWGLIGVAMVLIGSGLSGMIGFTSGMSSAQFVTAFPIFLQEMVMAVWLIVKGFNPVKENI